MLPASGVGRYARLSPVLPAFLLEMPYLLPSPRVAEVPDDAIERSWNATPQLLVFSSDFPHLEGSATAIADTDAVLDRWGFDDEDFRQAFYQDRSRALLDDGH